MYHGLEDKDDPEVERDDLYNGLEDKGDGMYHGLEKKDDMYRG